jgi:class 3 adenylate cyclase
VNLYFHLLERVVLEHGGHVDKFMGDAMMVVFGLFDMPLHDLQARLARNEPVPYSRQAVRAMVRARDAVRLFNRFLREAAPADLPAGLTPQVFGCGIASGYVTAGNIGGERKKDYTVLGSVVNLASRLESRSGQGEVLVDHHTRRNLGDFARCEARPPVELKGFDQPIALSEVVALDEVDFRGWAPALFDEVFVERALLQEDPLFDTALVTRHTAALRRLIAAFDPEPTRPG